MNYTKRDLELLSEHGVSLSITAADILNLLDSLDATRMFEQPSGEKVPLRDGIRLYKKSYKTLRKYINAGVLKGEKIGGQWYVETPQQRERRLK